MKNLKSKNALSFIIRLAACGILTSVMQINNMFSAATITREDCLENLEADLLKFSKKGNLEEVKKLIGLGADINCVKYCNKEVCKHLVPSHALTDAWTSNNFNLHKYVNCEDRHTPLMLASNNGHADIVEYLLRQKNIQPGDIWDFHSLLLLATIKSHKEVIKKLICPKSYNSRLGIMPLDYFDLLIYYLIKSEQPDKIDMIEFILSAIKDRINEIYPEKGTIFDSVVKHCGSETCHLDVIRLLLKAPNFNMNIYDEHHYGLNELLFESRKPKNILLALKLLIPIKEIRVNLPDSQQAYPLHYAFKNKYYSCAKWLLFRDDSESIMAAFQNALEDQDYEAIKIFLNHYRFKKHKHELFKNITKKDFEAIRSYLLGKGTLYVFDKYFNNPLHYAAISGDIQIIKLILSIAPSLMNIPNFDKETPMGLLQKKMHTFNALFIPTKLLKDHKGNSLLTNDSSGSPKEITKADHKPAGGSEDSIIAALLKMGTTVSSKASAAERIAIAKTVDVSGAEKKRRLDDQ